MEFGFLDVKTFDDTCTWVYKLDTRTVVVRFIFSLYFILVYFMAKAFNTYKPLTCNHSDIYFAIDDDLNMS